MNKLTETIVINRKLSLMLSLLFAPAFAVSAEDNLYATATQSSLLDVLHSDSDVFQKAKACQRLAIIGDESCTDALIELLGDPKLRFYALTALQRIPGEKVDTALLNALQSHEGTSRVGIIHAIGERRIDAAENELVRLFHSDATTTAEKQAAVRTLGILGKIDQVAGAETTSELQKRVTDDAILRVNRFSDPEIEPELPSASDAGFRDALSMLHSHDSRKVLCTSLIASLEKLPPTRQVLAMRALLELDPPAIADANTVSLSPINKLVDSEDVEVATTAVELLVSSGYYSHATALPTWVNDRVDLVSTALPLLSQANNVAFDRDVVARLSDAESSTTDDQVIGLVGYASERRLSAATPALLRLARGPKKEIASAAIAACGYTASVSQLGAMLDLLLKNSDVSFDQSDVDLCMSRACVRLPRDQAATVIEDKLQGVGDQSKIWLIGSLAQLGGNESLAVVTRAAQSGDDTLVDGATRALGEWLSTDVATPLHGLAESLPPGNYRTRALRAYLRIGRQFDMPKNERLDLCRRGLELSNRDDERLLVVDILNRNPSLESAQLVVDILRDADSRSASLQKRALAAVATITEKLNASEQKAIAILLDQSGVLPKHETGRERTQRFAE